jgi:hypothetical protein
VNEHAPKNIGEIMRNRRSEIEKNEREKKPERMRV